MKLPPSAVSNKGEYRLSSGTVPVDRDIFRKIVVRESRVPRVNAEDFSVIAAFLSKDIPPPLSTIETMCKRNEPSFKEGRTR